MSNFQFYENCTFCQSRIGSTHCLLPFELLKLYTPPEDEISKVMDITEIHMRYGIELLTTNFQSINWIKARPFSAHDSNFSVESNVKPSTWFEQVNEENVHRSEPSTNITSANNDDLESSYSDYITGELDEGALIDEISDSVQSLTYSESVKLAKSDEFTFKESSASKGKQSDASVITSAKLNATEQHEQEVSRSMTNHLVQDLVTIAKAAFNIHSTQRGGIKTNALKESLMNESNIRSMTGIRYQPSKDTSLDGNKALAKQLVAFHSSSEVHSWESCKGTSRGQYCVLNAKVFSLPMDEDNSSKLGEDLVRCFILMLRSQSRESGFRDSIVENVKFELSKNDYPSVFEWINNRFTFLENRKTKTDMTRSDTNEYSPIVKKLKEPYPPVDQKLLDFINFYLQVVVNRKIESFGDEVPTMSDETKLSTFLFKLTSEFLRRNKGWHNENSFTTPQHLAKLEQYTGLKSKPSESLLTFKILKEIINDFRLAYKQRDFAKAISSK